MDFKRIILMLSLFFLVFDCYLGYRVYQEYRSAQIRQTDYQQQSIEQRLSARGIAVMTNLSGEHSTGVLTKIEENDVLRDSIDQLVVGSKSFDENGRLNVTFQEPLSLNGRITQSTREIPTDLAQYIAQEYLSKEDLFIQGGAYTQYWYLPASRTLYFWMTATNDLPVVDGSAEIRLQLDENYNIASYSQTYQESFTPLQASTPYELISSKDAIEVLDTRIQTSLPVNSTIIFVNLSYATYKAWDNIKIYLPVWYVVYQGPDGQIGSMSVDAINGKVIRR